MDYLEKISDANALYDAYEQSKKGSDWKKSVQEYGMNLLENIYCTQKEIRDGTYKQRPFYEFTLYERGKPRHIKSMHISDRVVQRSVCDNVLIPELQKYLIYDNGASIKNKGISFARERIETHLHRYFRQNKTNEGYVLQIDFDNFFDNIPHDKLLAAFAEKIDDPEMMAFIANMINSFKVDVSYMSDEEYEACIKGVYDSLTPVDFENEPKGEKYLHKSLGIGSQISQISGVFYPTRIDNYCKIVRGVKYYERYMDDIIIIHNDKDFLKDLQENVTRIAEEMGLHINEGKTRIIKLEKGFTWLKLNYTLTKTGKVIKKPVSATFRKERKRLRKYHTLMLGGRMPFKDIEECYRSWRGNIISLGSYHEARKMDNFFNELFVDSFAKGEGYKNDRD